MVDIHCHLLPGVDDGAPTWEESLAMARIAVAEGITTIVATPHQLGANSHNHGPALRALCAQTQQYLREAGLPLTVLPGADVRIDEQLLPGLRSGEVLTLADRGRHVLLELPHELYFPLGPVLERLTRCGYQGILSHPERNQGLLRQPQLIRGLVERGCLMQVTAGSLLGGFGAAAQGCAEWMIREGCAHFLATDAHGSQARRPLMRKACERAGQLASPAAADQLCRGNPAAVTRGAEVEPVPAAPRRGSWFGWRRAG